jgi:NitT/TauT family transport system substrate-binding protein
MLSKLAQHSVSWRYARETIILLACLSTGWATGCADSRAEREQKPPPEKSILRISAIPIPQAAPLRIAKQRGFFQDEGLNVEITSYNSGVNVFRNGSVDIAMRDYISTLQDNENGLPMSVVQEIDVVPSGGAPIVVPPNSKIYKPTDLRGKKIAINSRNFPELATKVALQIHGLDARKDHIRFVVLPYAKVDKALTRGVVDAAWVFDPYLYQVERHGARRVLETATGPIVGLPATLYASRREFGQRYPKTVAAFKRAITRAQRLLAENPVLMEKEIATVTNSDPRLAFILRRPQFVTATSTNAVRIERIAESMLRFKFLRKRVNVRTLIPAY